MAEIIAFPARWTVTPDKRSACSRDALDGLAYQSGKPLRDELRRGFIATRCRNCRACPVVLEALPPLVEASA